jgi:hypothetical protein
MTVLGRISRGILGPWTGIVPTVATDPKSKQILDEFKARMQTVLIANGYKTDMGSNIFVQKDTPFTDDEIEGMDITYSDTPEQVIGREIHRMDIECLCALSGNDTMANVENAKADVVTAIGTDRTWDGLAEETGIVTAEKAAVAVGENIYAGTRVRFTIEYTTENMNAYQ